MLAGRQRLLPERHASLIDQPPRLGARHAELLGDQQRKVQEPPVAVECRLLDLLGGLPLDEHAVEVPLGRGCVLARVKPTDQIARERPLGVSRGGSLRCPGMLG